MHDDSSRRLAPITRHLLALGACGLAVAICVPLRDVLEPTNIAMLLLLTVVFVAAKLGRSPAVLASFVSVGLFDFFFVAPHLSFMVSDVQYVVTFAVMLAVSLLVSHLTSGLQASARESRDREHRAQALYALARALAGAVSVGQVVQRVEAFVREQVEAQPFVFLPDAADKLCVFPTASAGLGLDESMMLDAVYRSHAGEPSCSSSGPQGSSLLFPLAGATRRHGVLLVRARDRDRLEGLRPMVEAVASLTAIALERLHLVEHAQGCRMDAEAERLRSSILSSISHDLRTPLTVLFGQADALAIAAGRFSGDEREAARAIRDQAGRLNRMVEKLLDMARLQAGRVRLYKEWQAVDEIVGASIRLLGDALREHSVKVLCAADLPLVSMDAVLMERVFCNLIENAAKYSAPGMPITIGIAADSDGVVIEVSDRGEGIPPDRLVRIFELFERGAPRSPTAGVGLGLAICRAIVRAHGGEIGASNRAGGGACVRIAMPLGGVPPGIEPEPADSEGADS